ncbi:phospholipase A [Campylobacter corcagiensis]|uniref:Phosphatidylcholine 1-acylhydrolase n=1 Tax=Campylobacter corcagiensis TaxID=1448857 RepID=A0A7M1LHC3_9BACT|nr:phospholipase A [Campylobacter corcagiensis]QKF64057.1 phospholipase A1 [Campylobacter corcagiensis]QOQ87743.1 phospholipase A [Campylobacter corcagiensis]
MKKISVLSLVCASFLMANNSEIYQKALEYEAKGDYKSAMLEYKKLATKVVVPQNTIAKDESFFDASSQNTEPTSTQNAQTLYTKDTKSSSKKSLYPKAKEENPQWLYMYEPTYIGWAYDFNDKDGRNGKGRKNDELKFQLSFQKPLFDDLIGLDETWSIAYTQTSFWQIREDSAPFRTSSYQPELFVTIPTEGFFDYVRFGFNHESNGKDGMESRSWNRVYASTTFDINDFRITPRIWHSFTFDKDNEDIRQYMGYGDVKFAYDIGRHHLTAMWRNNLRFDSNNRGALELNYYFPLFNTGLHGFLQYFTGYGESLDDYNKHVDKIMLGIAFYQE